MAATTKRPLAASTRNSAAADRLNLAPGLCQPTSGVILGLLGDLGLATKLVTITARKLGSGGPRRLS